MNIVRLLLILSIAGGGYSYWKKHHHALPVPAASGPAISENGFAALPPANGQSANKVFVVAAENCPHEEAQRADRLARELSRQGIPVERTHHVRFHFSGAGDGEMMSRVSNTMNGPLPIVFINGRAKPNPSLDEVVAEYRSSRH